MKIAITGASGFVGSNLAHFLHKCGHNVIALVRSKEKASSFEKDKIATRISDITDRLSLASAFEGVEVVMHLAALFNSPEASWDEYRKVNIEGTRNVMDAAIDSGVKRVVHCSTIGVATGSGKLPFSEETPYSPPKWDKYEVSKCEGEKLALEYHERKGLSVIVLRPAQVYGPGDRSKAKFYRMVKKGFIVNPGKIFKHPIFTDDLCRAFEIVSSHPKAGGEIFIIGDKSAIPLKELITIVAKELGVVPPSIILPPAPITLICTITESLCNILKIKPPIFRRSMDFFTKSVQFDVTKAKTALGFESYVDIHDGVAKTAAWYKRNDLI
jgi:nucleoside-diphosphate-sugar epimerase